MPSILNSDDGVVSGTSGLKTTGGNDGLLNIQTNGSTAMSINASQQVTFNNGVTMPNTFGFENRLINGGMVIDQRNAGAAVTLNNTASYTLDRWYDRCVGGAGSAVMTVQRSTTAPTGFTNSKLTTVTTSKSPAVSEQFWFYQAVEGLNMSDFGMGTASAVTFTLSFWVRASVTGTYSVAFQNSAQNRSYVATYTVNAANTFEYKTVTITGDTTGTWLTDNGVGMYVFFDTGSGSNFNSTAGAWTAGTYYRTSGSVSLIANSGATFYITGVQLERGSAATSFDFRSIGQELLLCQRYYEKSYTQTTVPGTATQDGCFMTLRIDSVGSGSEKYKVTKRAAPTITTYNPEAANTTGARNYSTNGNITTTIVGIGDTGFYFVPGSSSTGNGIGIQWVAAIEL
jgi:hypothetical protein